MKAKQKEFSFEFAFVLPSLMLVVSDPVYTVANDSVFVANPGCFDIVYTKEHESDTKLSQIDYESGTFESENVCGSLYSRKFESDKTSRVNSFRKII